MDFSLTRSMFPVTRDTAYLNNAAESPLSTNVRARLQEYLDFSASAPQNKPSVRQETRILLADLFGGLADEYALVPGTGMGIGMVAEGFEWRSGDNVVVPVGEHWNNTFPWLSLERRGVEVRFCPLEADYRIDPDRIAGLMDTRTRILSIAAVRHTSGFRADLRRLGSIAHERGALFLVDGIQAVGVCPLDVERDGIDILACGGFKWLLGLPGTGFLYVNKNAQEKIQPVLPGMFSAEDNLAELRFFSDARRYETGTIAYPLYYAWAAGLELLNELGVKRIHERVLGLADSLIVGLRKKNFTIISPVEREIERSAIISFTAGSPEKNKILAESLASRGIIISVRDGRCRASPNFFNDAEDVASFLEELQCLP